MDFAGTKSEARKKDEEEKAVESGGRNAKESRVISLSKNMMSQQRGHEALRRLVTQKHLTGKTKLLTCFFFSLVESIRDRNCVKTDTQRIVHKKRTYFHEGNEKL